MDDLIKRLRDADAKGKAAYGMDLPPLLEAAAALTEAQATIARLEAALEDIADGMGETEMIEVGRWAPHVALAALSPGKGE